MNKLLIVLLTLMLFGSINAQRKDFTITNGALNWSTDLGSFSGMPIKISESADAAIYSEFGMKLAVLERRGDDFPKHTINGDTTYSFQEFMQKATKAGLGGVNTDKMLFYQLMDDIGDGTGNVNMAVNGSVTPDTFKVVVPAGGKIKIARIIVSVRDESSFDAGGWGNNGGLPLANGLVLKVRLSGVLFNFTNNPIKSHYDLASYSFDLNYQDWGQGDAFISNRFTFTKAGQYLVLNEGDEFIVIVSDDLSYLVDQRVSVQGYWDVFPF